MPTGHGLFRVEGSELVPVTPGDKTGLQPTNGERGFGFTRPQGDAMWELQPLWVLWTGEMSTSTLRLTRFDPEALLPERWWQESAPGRVGWLASSLIPLTVESIDSTPGAARIQPKNPLVPGFYVLHDGDLLSARRRGEVGVFYPFTVFEHRPEQEAHWLEWVEDCAEDLGPLLLDAQFEGRDEKERASLDRPAFKRNYATRLEHCAEQLQAVMMSSTTDREQAQNMLRALDAIVYDLPTGQFHESLEACASRFSTGPLLFYWIEVTAIEFALEGRRAVAGGDLAGAAKAANFLRQLYLDRSTPRADEPFDALASLLWVPYFVDPQWAPLTALTDRLATGLNPYEEAFLLIAAHRAHRLSRFETLYPTSPLDQAARALLRGLPAEVLEAAKGLDPTRAKNGFVHFGGVHIKTEADPTRVPVAALERFFRGRKRALATCYQDLEKRLGAPTQGLVIAKVTLTQSYFGGAVSLRLLGAPLKGQERLNFGDARFQTCVTEEALAGLPSEAAGVDAEITLPIVFDGDRASAELIR